MDSSGRGIAPQASQRKKGARVRISGNEIVVTDGPFAETKELIGG